MRFSAIVYYHRLSSKADTLIITSASLNFVSKAFVIANGFYKYCKTSLKLSIQVDSVYHIYTTKVFCPSVVTIDGHEFSELQFRVLPHFKSLDIILGNTSFKEVGCGLYTSLNTFSMGDFTIRCNNESRRISCMIV